MHWLTIIGIILITIGTFCTYLGSNIGSKKSDRKLLDRITENEKVIKNYDKKQKEMINMQIDVYRETLDKVVKGEIPLPPDFIKLQEKTLLSSTKDIEEWAKKLGDLEGMEKEKLELEFIAVDTRAAQIDAKLRPSIQPIIYSFQEVISALNKTNAFGGRIDIQVFEVNDRIVIAHTEYKKPQRPIQPIINITFPNGKKWIGKLFPLIIKPDTPKNFEYGPFIHLFADNIRVEFYILQDGTFRFVAKEPNQGWPEGLSGKTGGNELIAKAVKSIFQKEMMLNQGGN